MDVALKDAERNLSSLLDAAAQGQDIVITRDGHAIARLVPVQPTEIDEAIIATLSPAAQRIWARRQRLKLGDETITDLITEGRR